MKKGILLHISSLPGKEPIGTLGKEAHQFLDYLKAANQNLWQILPINPASLDGNPFTPIAVFAGNPNLISLEPLVIIGDLENSNYKDYLRNWQESSHNDSADYDFLFKFKFLLLQHAYNGFKKNNDQSRLTEFQNFCKNNSYWLDDYALFMALKEIHSFIPWYKWPEEDKFRYTGCEKKVNKRIEFYKYIQFVFHEQFNSLYKKAKQNNIEIIGDIPIYPAYDSVDVWANKELFQLNNDAGLKFRAAVPPDYFSKNGQLWGNPIYKWDVAGTKQQPVYDWWAKRLERLLEYHDYLKLDHFRGFIAYGRVSSKAKTAKNAKWIPGPGIEFFEYLKEYFKHYLPLIAEDLGVITPTIRKQLNKLGFPGMRILLFANPKNKKDYHLPENSDSNSVFYTGTHDNETLMQKIYAVMNASQRKAFLNYLSHSSEKAPNWQAIDLLYQSNSKMVILPMQDILALGKQARMNTPGTTKGNWKWRMTKEQFDNFAGKIGNNLKKLSQKIR